MARRDRLAEVRRKAGWSQRTLARHLDVARSTVQRWEDGESDPYPRQLPGLAAALSVSVNALDDMLAEVDRRTLLAGVGTSVVGAAVDRITHAANGGRITADVIEPLRQVTDHLRRIDDEVGGGATLPLVEPQVEFVTRLLHQGSYMPAVGQQLHHVLADVAELAGWAAYDAGDLVRSGRHYAASLHAAHEAGDPLLVTHTLAMMGFSTRYQPDTSAEQLLGAAWSSIPAGSRNDGVRAFVCAWQAQAAAGRGDRAGFDRMLAESSTFYERSRREDWPEWMYWLWHPEQMADTGHALNMVGEHRRSIEWLSEGEKRAADWPRDQVLYVAFLAEAHDGLREHDEAEHHRGRARDLMGDDVVSARLAQLIG